MTKGTREELLLLLQKCVRYDIIISPINKNLTRRLRYMEGKITMFIISLICAVLFFGIGVHAKRSNKPVGFWSGGPQIDASKITDIEKYNKANAIMWQHYSLFYFASALFAIFSPIISAILLMIGCTLGIGLLIALYNKICKKYMIK